MHPTTTLLLTRSCHPSAASPKALKLTFCNVAHPWHPSLTRSPLQKFLPLNISLRHSRFLPSQQQQNRFLLQRNPQFCFYPYPIRRFLSTSSISPPHVQPSDSISDLKQHFENIQSSDVAQIAKLVEKQFPFRLDDFQISGLNALCSNKNVVLSAPTGSGKTVIGEIAIYLTLCKNRRLFYCTPLKALSNQKFGDFKRQFGASRVGLLTGDVTVNRDAPIIVMTTEIYRNMLYAEATERIETAPRTDDLFAVVLDEFHYLNNQDRGSCVEESVINSPSHILLIALSATMSNANHICDWFGEVQGPTALIESTVRTVPLRFGYFDYEGLTPLFEDNKRSENDVEDKRRKMKGFSKRSNAGGKKSEPKMKMHPKLLRKLKGDSVPDSKPRSSSSHSRNNELDTYDRLRRIVKKNGRREKYVGIPSHPFVVRTLEKRDMLPAIVFLFSRAGCDRAAMIASQEESDLLSSSEREIIHTRLQAFVSQNPDMVQPDRLKQALQGIASHHAGLLPLWKLCIEELFQDGLIKIVFATETLAAGINMPARTTVISSLSKRAGEEGIRLLTTSEVLQMAGRAGRRGKDSLGYSLILRSRNEGALDAFKILTREADKLESQFTPTYGMVLNLLLSRPLSEAKKLVNRSFGNYLRLHDHANGKGDGRGGKAPNIDALRREKVALLNVLVEARDQLRSENDSDLRLFMKTLERIKAEKRAFTYLWQQSAEMDGNVIQDSLTFAPAGTRLLLREKRKKSSGAERRQKRRGLVAALSSAGEGDFGAELRSFFFSEGDELEELEEDEGVDDMSEIEAIFLDLHSEPVGTDSSLVPIFSAVDAHGQFRLFTHSAVSSILFDEDAFDVDTIAPSWSDTPLPPRSSWRSTTHDQWQVTLPPSLENFVPYVQSWRNEREQAGTAKTTASDLHDLPELKSQRARVDDARRLAREHVLYGRDDLGSLLACKKAVSTIESILDGSHDPIDGRKRRRKGLEKGRYTVLDFDEDTGIVRTDDNGGPDETSSDTSTWDEFMSLVGVLQHYGMLDEDYTVTTLGEVAAKVRSENEIWSAIVLLDPNLEGVSPIHLAAILGATQMERSRGDVFVEWEVSKEVREHVEQFEAMRTRLFAVQMEFGAPVGLNLDAELMGLVEMWASGMSWVELIRATSVSEGDVCRILRQTMDIVRQIVHLPPMVSDNLKRNARRAIALMDRFPITDDRTYSVDISEKGVENIGEGEK